MPQPNVNPSSLGAVLRFASAGQTPRERRAELIIRDRIYPLFFRVPEDQAEIPTSRADPFVIACLLTCMKARCGLTVEGLVSSGLLANLADFQAAFCARHPDYHPITITTFAELPPTRDAEAEGGLVAFSGGVDGAFSIYRHSPHTGPSDAVRRPIRAALLVHGFDVPLEQREMFRDVAAGCVGLTDGARIPLLTVETNLRTLPVPWVDSFGAAIAAALSAFSDDFRFGLIGSAYSYDRTRLDHGSNPLNDPLLSSDQFQLVHDGANFGRIDKLRVIAEFPAVRRHLRVCWQGGTAHNCCRCEKCIRTILMLDFLGAPTMAAFPHMVTPVQLDTLVLGSSGAIDEISYLLDAVRASQRHFWWAAPLQRCLWRSRLRVFVRARFRGALRWRAKATQALAPANSPEPPCPANLELAR